MPQQLDANASLILNAGTGDKYVGEYKDGKRHGQGIHTRADGKVEEGIFENGKFKYARKVTPKGTAEGSPSSSSPQPPDRLIRAKTKCVELGFAKGTEKYGECVLKLYD